MHFGLGHNNNNNNNNNNNYYCYYNFNISNIDINGWQDVLAL